MRRSAHFSMLFISILALQLNALGGGVACLLAASTGQMGVADAGMATMGMVTTAPAADEAPCHGSAAPHASCQSMTQCAAILAIAPAPREAKISSPGSYSIDLVTLVPPSRSLSPDVPPPKA